MTISTTVRLAVVATLVVSAFGAAGLAAADDHGSLTTVNETVRVHAVEDAGIEGTTELSAGTNVSVRVQSTDGTEPRFIKTETVAVGEGGEFAASFDFSDQEPGDAFSVRVVQNGSAVATADGAVVAEDVAVSPEPTTETTGPGFGVATALVAALAALVAVGRRID